MIEHEGPMKDIEKISKYHSKKIANSGAAMNKQNQGGHQMQLGAWQLWRSLPRPCKLFLVVCVVQAFVAGAFAARELARVRFILHFLVLNNHYI
jgi:hypothetical protein